MQRPRWLFAIGVGVLIFGGISLWVIKPLLPIGCPFGRLAAQRDIARGHYELKQGSIFDYPADYSNKMLNQYGIIATNNGGCLSGEYERTYKSAYNAGQAKAFKERTGLDLFKVSREHFRESFDAAKEAFQEKEKSTNH